MASIAAISVHASQIAFSSAPFGHPGSDDFRQVGTVTPQPNGLVTVAWAPTAPDGTVPLAPTTILGLSPFGNYSMKPANAIGNGEQFRLADGCLTVRPNVDNRDGSSVLIPGEPTVAYVIAYRVVRE